MYRQVKRSDISRYNVGMWVQKCHVEILEGAVETDRWKCFLGFNHHFPYIFWEECVTTSFRSSPICISNRATDPCIASMWHFRTNIPLLNLVIYPLPVFTYVPDIFETPYKNISLYKIISKKNFMGSQGMSLILSKWSELWINCSHLMSLFRKDFFLQRRCTQKKYRNFMVWLHL